MGSQKLEGVDLKQHCVEQQLSRCRPLGRVFLDAQSQKILQRNHTDQHSSNNKQTSEKGKSMGIFYTLNPPDLTVQQIWLPSGFVFISLCTHSPHVCPWKQHFCWSLQGRLSITTNYGLKYLPKPICWADWWQYMQGHYLPSVGGCPARWGYLQCPLLWQSCRHHSHGCQGRPSGKQIGRKTKTLLSRHCRSMSYISWTLLTTSACERVRMCMCLCMHAFVNACVCMHCCAHARSNVSV